MTEQVVAITGAGGFVGRRLVDHFAQKEFRVFALTSRPHSIPCNAAIQPVPCDWTPDGFDSAFRQARKAALWVHAAARLSVAQGNALRFYEANACLTARLAALLRAESPDSRAVYLSTISVYGESQEIALAVEPRPDTHYGMSKYLGERLAQACLGPRCLILRLAGVWGVEEAPKLFVNRCILMAARGQSLAIDGSGVGKRNYIWVGDIPLWVERGWQEAWTGVYLTASPFIVSIREMMQIIAERFGVRLRTSRRSREAAEPDVVIPVLPGVPGTAFRTALVTETVAADEAGRCLGHPR